MGRNMHTIYKWLKELFATEQRDDIDQYLQDSVDVYDLEFRIRALARKGII